MAQGKMTVTKNGFNLAHVTIDSAYTPITWLLIISGVYSFVTGMHWLFISCFVIALVLFIFTFIKDPNKLRGEKFNLDWEKLHLGSMKKPDFIEGEVVQPEVHMKQISAKANIEKPKRK